MSEKPKIERILVDVFCGALVPQSELKEYCEEKYQHKVLNINYGNITFVDFDNGEIKVFIELQDYIKTVEKLHEVEQKLKNLEGF